MLPQLHGSGPEAVKVVFSYPWRPSIHLNCWGEHGTCWAGFQIVEWVQREEEWIGEGHGCSCSRPQPSSFCGLLFPQSGVLQVKQTAWSSPSGGPGKQQALSLGWHEFWDYSLPGQVSAGWSLQPGLKDFELFTKQDPCRKVMTT